MSFPRHLGFVLAKLVAIIALMFASPLSKLKPGISLCEMKRTG